MIFVSDINKMINILTDAGANVYDGNFAIYTNKNVIFDNDIYPLEIITSAILPDGVTCIIARKPEDSPLQLQPPMFKKGRK